MISRKLHSVFHGICYVSFIRGECLRCLLLWIFFSFWILLLSWQQLLLNENETLRSQLVRLNEHCEGRTPDKARKVMLDQLNQRFANHVHELRTIQRELDNLLNTSWRITMTRDVSPSMTTILAKQHHKWISRDMKKKKIVCCFTDLLPYFILHSVFSVFLSIILCSKLRLSQLFWRWWRRRDFPHFSCLTLIPFSLDKTLYRSCSFLSRFKGRYIRFLLILPRMSVLLFRTRHTRKTSLEDIRLHGRDDDGAFVFIASRLECQSHFSSKIYDYFMTPQEVNTLSFRSIAVVILGWPSHDLIEKNLHHHPLPVEVTPVPSNL